ncbi:TonB-dependent receptor [Myroides odoratimimus]|uniref:TonB-dependent receptor n=1 Tax=Myroides odoratimimus TaxID=76832 RepID=UPI00046A62C1|nr:TonB-dependent receptor [Myroides odoratimimus]
MRISILMLSLVASIGTYAQQYVVKGKVSDIYGEALVGSNITFSGLQSGTDLKGQFISTPVSAGQHRLLVEYLGYKTVDTLLTVKSDMYLDLHLKEDNTLLDQVVVSTHGLKTIANTEVVSNKQLVESFSGSFAKTLTSVPGVNAMDIGAGASKPIIRGLGFNRVAVAENGAKQEGQQWGADHGLEIDAFSTEEVEVIKGVGTIEYGSDAIGGVIKINNEKVPEVHSFSGSATMFGKTVNDSYGASVQVKGRDEKFFYKFKATGQDAGDYRVPVSEINYLNTVIPIHGNRMKNTASKNFALYGQIGYVDNNFKNILSISNVYDKSGFFPGSHGLPNVASVADDGNHRNIEYPRQNVNHFKVVNTTTWDSSLQDKWTFMVAYQNNRRQEHSLFHSHFDDQTPPSSNPNLELQFVLNTVDASVKYEHLFNNNHKLTLGVQQNFQNNTIDGYGFLLPKFNRQSTGVFGMYEYFVNDKLTLEGGARFDYASVHVKPFYDQFLFDYLKEQGYADQLANKYAQRSTTTDRDFTSVNGMVGAKYTLNDNFNFGATVGTNFRFPTAIELASNGVHHGAFRHEKGNPDLDPEKGIALDFRAEFKTPTFNTTFSPYLYYFSNYIYLKPSGKFSILPDSGQIYEYTQSEAIISGFEWKVEKRFFDRLNISAVLEYIYNQQVSNGQNGAYPLPFTPPMNVFGEVRYSFRDTDMFKESEVYFNGKWYAEQERIAQGEEVTPSSQSFGAGVSSTVQFGKFKARTTLSISNMFDTKILNHTSFYRPLGIPELGRSIQLMIQVPF